MSWELQAASCELASWRRRRHLTFTATINQTLNSAQKWHDGCSCSGFLYIRLIMPAKGVSSSCKSSHTRLAP
jgi:hypothetical protein